MFTRVFLLPKYLGAFGLYDRAAQVFKTSTCVPCDEFIIEEVGETEHSVKMRVSCQNSAHLHYTSNSR